ncbi:MAG TPA: hypothetical protein VIH10_16010 [Kribbella sp.]
MSGFGPIAATVSHPITTMISPPPAARVCAMVASTGVSSLKCDGTCRHTCTEISATSAVQAAVNNPNNQFLVRPANRR